MDLQPAWYATPERADSRTKWIVYDDIGALSVDQNQLSFAGTRLRIERREIENIALTRQRINSVTYLIVGLLALPMKVVIAYAIYKFFDISILVTLAALYLFFMSGSLVGFATKWVRVRFADGREPRVALFADGGAHGWRGIGGGTTELFRQINEQLGKRHPELPT